jgi:Putative zinc-finger/Gram-negative bacterial TonB protein C-terminal
VRERLSAFVDRELAPGELGAVARHLEACNPCRTRHEELREASRALSALPQLQAHGEIAAAVTSRLEVERRGPGLRLLFRPARRARPPLLPSLLPAALVFAVVLSGALVLGRPAEHGSSVAAAAGAWSAGLPPSGTEANPLVPSDGVALPQLRDRSVPEAFRHVGTGEDSVFLETVVGRDGRVSAVNVIQGGRDPLVAQALARAVQRERFVPGRLDGRPVAVSLYRLFSRVEVRARTT